MELKLLPAFNGAGEDVIRLPEFGLLDNDSFGLVITWFGHFSCNYFMAIGYTEVKQVVF